MKKYLLVALCSFALLTPSATASVSENQPERVYYVMLDRFNNGNAANDYGSATDAATGGFDPTNSGFWQGGDFAGLQIKLPYIKDLGFTSVWVSPVVRNQTIAVDGKSTGYHGYWGLGFDQTDPHFGTIEEFKSLVNAAHQLGLKIILDIVINHTGDVVQLYGGSFYISTSAAPYRTCAGKKFDAAKTAGTTAFPALTDLCLTKSFPKQPWVSVPDAAIKSPDWLNDLRLYHNRGNSTFDGESSHLGDFYGLDDLFTESPVVVSGLTTLWQDWIRNTGIDGFRIDTARHVNEKFWRSFIPGIKKTANELGKANFPIWGEAWETDPANSSYWVVDAGIGGGLDFAFQERAQSFLINSASAPLAALFNEDDYYLSPNSNVNTWGTFLGNHDMGRIGGVLARNNSSADRTLKQAELGYALLFLLRGSPIVYYGDEFGLTGGSDKAARQTLFPSQVSSWQSEPRVGGEPIGWKSSFETTNPLQSVIRDFNVLRQQYAALGDGVQQVRYAKEGTFAASRFDLANRREYVVAFNGTDMSQQVKISTATSTNWKRIAGAGELSGGALALPALSWGFFQAQSPLPASSAPAVSLFTPNFKGPLATRIELKAKVPGADPVRVEFFGRINGGPWRFLGADTSRTFSNVSANSGWFRLYPIRSQFPASGKASFKATVTTSDGRKATSGIKTVTLTK